MTILALEFSAAERSVAVAAAGQVLATAREPGSGRLGPLALVTEALGSAGLERRAVEGLAVGLGPGSYTGIRVAIALAQGWQLAAPVRVLGLSSVEVMAAQAQAAGWRGEVALVVDAQRGEFYCADYELHDRRVRVRQGLHLARGDALAARAARGTRLAGPDRVPGEVETLELIPDAAMLARLASRLEGWRAGGELEPIYLRAAAFVKAPPPRRIPPLPAVS